ncbi:MAG: sensor histidine kinase [Coprobacillus sp.]|nr:sensor histidine kinase [Coprobacillus sp.]
MDELALNILDIAYNSIRAQASQIDIRIIDSIQKNIVDIEITDNGQGMTKEEVDKVIDPFFTTRTTRKVGLGIPLFKQSAELTGGYLSIHSQKNQGTKVKTRFIKNHIDTPIMGNIIETIMTLIQADENIDYVFEYETDNIHFIMNTQDIKSILEEVKITEPEVIVWLKDYMKEGLSQ